MHLHTYIHTQYLTTSVLFISIKNNCKLKKYKNCKKMCSNKNVSFRPSLFLYCLHIEFIVIYDFNNFRLL